MEAQWLADRTTLRTLLRTHPHWTVRDFAQTIDRSHGWVKKWRKRLCAAPPDDDIVLHSRSRVRKHPPPPLDQRVIDRILAIRDQPPANLHRIPGPKAILYFLRQDADLQTLGLRLPRSTRTIWQILRQYGRIALPGERRHTPVDRPPPMTSWQLDFKDASTVPADPDGKQQHVVEVLNTIQPVEKPPPERRGSITVEEILPGVEGERRPRRATTLEIYSGTVEFDQKSGSWQLLVIRPYITPVAARDRASPGRTSCA
jgi:hypothetical protein